VIRDRDAEVLALCERWRADRDERALAELVALAGGLVRVHASRWLPRCAPDIGIDDLLQGGRLGVWRFAETYRDPRVSAFTVINRRIIDGVRSVCGRRRYDRPPGGLVYLDAPLPDLHQANQWDFVPSTAPAPDEIANRADERDWVERNLRRLPPAQKAFARLALDGHTNREICGRLRASSADVSFTLKRAARKLKAMAQGAGR
jgi:RNA polymerase sigma factor (sigma-70 family)